ncbi:hypothetical protein [Yoonia sp. R2-816]|uniref:hypothetical protein n=1 Tax=Yoonia sp. R2-816 TaxID=3342638 RepID=UPI00372D2DAC
MISVAWAIPTVVWASILLTLVVVFGAMNTAYDAIISDVESADVFLVPAYFGHLGKEYLLALTTITVVFGAFFRRFLKRNLAADRTRRPLKTVPWMKMIFAPSPKFVSRAMNQIIAEYTARLGVKGTARARVSSETSLMVSKNQGFIYLSIIFLLAMCVFTYSYAGGLLHEFFPITLGLTGIVIMHRGLQLYRVYMGYYGLNLSEAIEFMEWLRKKNISGDDDFGDKAVEKLRTELLKDYSMDSKVLGG